MAGKEWDRRFYHKVGTLVACIYAEQRRSFEMHTKFWLEDQREETVCDTYVHVEQQFYRLRN
jgi:hypothetical protein